MKKRIRNTFAVVTFMFGWALPVGAQTPAVEKVGPPNWWAGMTVNPVRILVRGAGLNSNVTVSTNSKSIRAANPRSSSNGHYLFFDLTKSFIDAT